MNGVTEPGVVVGVSGSQGSLHALRWAAAEAHERHRPLTVVLAWETTEVAAYSSAMSHPDRDEHERAACHTLEVALRSAFGTALPRGLVIRVAEGNAERVLIEESAGADLLVLGSAVTSSPSGAYIGPVVRACLSRAACPVVVIGALAVATPTSAMATPPSAVAAPPSFFEPGAVRSDDPAHEVVKVDEPVAV